MLHAFNYFCFLLDPFFFFFFFFIFEDNPPVSSFRFLYFKKKKKKDRTTRIEKKNGSKANGSFMHRPPDWRSIFFGKRLFPNSFLRCPPERCYDRWLLSAESGTGFSGIGSFGVDSAFTWLQLRGSLERWSLWATCDNVALWKFSGYFETMNSYIRVERSGI